jgi:hypothetical protein
VIATQSMTRTRRQTSKANHAAALGKFRHHLLMQGGIKYQVQRLKKLVDAPCFSSAF